MSPLNPFGKPAVVKESPEDVTPPEPTPVPVPVPPEVKPTILVSEADAYIHERMQQQPATLAEAVSEPETPLREGMHRLSLPDELETYSYDCSQGVGCAAHAWKQFVVTFGDGAQLPRWEYDRTGKEFIFRWVPKIKRVLDDHINLDGWMFVNRRYFPKVAHYLFTANGGVEVGGDILMFLPVKKALALRKAPGERSRDMLRGRISPDQDDPKRVLMGDPRNPKYYMPDMGAESGEGEVAPAPGSIVLD